MAVSRPSHVVATLVTKACNASEKLQPTPTPLGRQFAAESGSLIV